MFAIWWAFLLWAEFLMKGDRALILHCDNDFARFAVNNRWTRADGHTMRLLRHLAILLSDYNIRFHVIYIPSAAAPTTSRTNSAGTIGRRSRRLSSPLDPRAA